MSNRPIKVTLFSRRPPPGAFSIERVVADIRAAIPEGVRVIERVNTHLSRGVVPRLRDALAAHRHADSVNHITGDVHYLAYFLPGDRTVLTVHDTLLVERERGLKRFLIWLFWFWLPAHRVGWITAISHESKRRLLSLVAFDPDRVTVIPDPVSPDFVPTPLPPREGAYRLLHIGTKPNKNLERLAAALGGLDVELTVIGRLSGTQAEALAAHGVALRQLAGLDNAALRAEYSRAEALVFVSLDEGFGLPIVEAQASGRPVITSARAPMDDVAGGAALLVDPEDEAAIRAAVQRLAGDGALRTALVAQGTRNVARFDVNTIAGAYTELYARIDREAAQ